MTLGVISVAFAAGTLSILISSVLFYRIGVFRGRKAEEKSVEEWLDMIAERVRKRNEVVHEQAQRAREIGGNGDARDVTRDGMSDADFRTVFGYPKSNPE